MMDFLCRQVKRYIIPKNKSVLYSSIVLCIIIPAIFCRWLPNRITGFPIYKDFIAGGTTWNGYNINKNLIVIYTYLAVYVFSVIAIPFVLNFISGRKIVEPKVEEQTHTHMSKLFVIGAFTFCISYIVLNGSLPLNVFVVLMFILCLHFLLSASGAIGAATGDIVSGCTSSPSQKTCAFCEPSHDITPIFSKLCLISLYLYFYVIAAFILVNTLTKRGVWLYSSYNTYAIMGLLAFVLLLALMFSLSKIKEATIDDILMISQIFLPLVFLAFYRFSYEYNGGIVTQFYSSKLKYTCFSLSLVMILFNIYKYFKIKVDKLPPERILWTTGISIISFIAFKAPIGTLLTDFFHIGELTTPMQQLVRFGKVPFFDYFPIHGLLDYFNQSVNYLFFGGEYGTYFAAAIIGNIIKAVLIYLPVRYFVSSAALPFILSILVVNSGANYERMLGVFLFLIILYNAKNKKDLCGYVWWWIIASIFAVLWNPALGAAAVISSIPFIIYTFLSEGGLESFSSFKLKDYRNRAMLFWIPLIILCLCLIPLAYQVIAFVLDYSKSTLLANGNAANFALEAIKKFNNGIANSVLTLIARPFGFSLSVSFLLLIGYKNRSFEKKNMMMVLQILLLVTLLASYTFVRADSSLGRANSANMVIAAVVMIACAAKILHSSPKLHIVIYSILISLFLSGNLPGLFTQHSKVISYPKISSDYVVFDGKQEGISDLGVVYTSQDRVDLLISMNELLQGVTSFFDLSNNIAYDAIFNKPSVIPYTSMYNAYNETLHQKYLDAIKASPPELALVSPCIKHDGGGIAFRSYPIYRWLMVNGYKPFKYKDIVFLLHPGSEKIGHYESANEEFFNVIHKKELGFLPILWGSDEICDTRIMSTDVIVRVDGVNQIRQNGTSATISGNGPFVICQTDSPINGIDNDFIKLTLESEYDLTEESDFQLFWVDEGEEFDEKKSYTFKGKEGTLLIPVGASPSWTLSNSIRKVRLDFPSSMEGKAVPNITMEIMRYIEK